MSQPLVILPFLGHDGQLRAFGADSTGKWHSTVSFLPGRISTSRDDKKNLLFYLGPWRDKKSPKEEISIARGILPCHLQLALSMLRSRLIGIEVFESELGIMVVDRSALNRAKVEIACIWLNLAGQYLDVVSKVQLSSLMLPAGGSSYVVSAGV